VLFLWIAGSPACAEDASPSPVAEAAAPDRGTLPAEGSPGFIVMSPVHGVPFQEPSPALPDGQQNEAAPAPSQAEPVPPTDPSGGAAGLPAADSPAEDAAAPKPEAPASGPEEAASQESVPAVNAALKAALETRSGLPDPLGLLHGREREAVAAFYASRDFAPLWWSGGKPTTEAGPVFERLRRAADDGLDIKGFRLAFSPATEEEIAAADIALTDAVVAYGRQASGSRIDPHMISRLIGAEPEVADPAVILALVSTAGEDAGEELRRFNPPQRPYQALREKLRDLRHGHGLAGRDPGGTSPASRYA
jgi:L,D-transpeptidase YcbB